jgi:DNA-directed RNA polymerase subunit RPC12/RpoP
MGLRYLFACPSCGYTTVVSGGDDMGMSCATTTMVCSRCKTLSDVVMAQKPWDEKAIVENTLVTCPYCSGPVTRWTGRRCPKCRGVMEAQGGGIPWD